VLYIIKRVLDCYDTLRKALYSKKISKKEIIHILNFRKLFEKIPKIIEEVRESPQSFFGLCKAEDILKDNAKIVGVSISKTLIIRDNKELFGIDFSLFTNLSFIPSSNLQEINNPLAEIYQRMGIPQYMLEIEKKRVLEKLFAKDYTFCSN
jgi:hypothetical protein